MFVPQVHQHWIRPWADPGCEHVVFSVCMSRSWGSPGCVCRARRRRLAKARPALETRRGRVRETAEERARSWAKWARRQKAQMSKIPPLTHNDAAALDLFQFILHIHFSSVFDNSSEFTNCGFCFHHCFSSVLQSGILLQWWTKHLGSWRHSNSMTSPCFSIGLLLSHSKWLKILLNLLVWRRVLSIWSLHYLTELLQINLSNNTFGFALISAHFITCLSSECHTV